VSKDELRVQLEKLGRANASLRVRNKELKRAVDEAADRIAQLEGQLARQERRAAQPAASRRGRRSRRQPAVNTRTGTQAMPRPLRCPSTSFRR
jgi:predicted RNase H-like nuclease (RuvC/YqgF family)